MKKAMLVFTALPLIFASCKTETTGYSGEDLTGLVSVIRDDQTKSALANVGIDGAWKIYSGPTVEDIDMRKPLLAGDKQGTYPLPVDKSSRSYFQFTSARGNAILAERHLPMEGGYNFRDLGGYRTADGRYVKWGKLFRSDDLHNLTKGDLAYLGSIPINSIVDFRAAEEVIEAPDKLPAPSTSHYHLAIVPGNLNDVARNLKTTREDMGKAMEGLNVSMISEPEFVEQYRKFFALLQDEANAPLLYHCSAGKDRTGMASALILYALGVDDETIMADYMLSNTYLKGKYDDIVNEYPNVEPLMTVQPEFLQAGIDRIRQDHGSIDNFLSGPLDVDLAKFRQLYLY